MEVYFKHLLGTRGVCNTEGHFQGRINGLICAKNTVKHYKNTAIVLINALMIHAVMDSMKAWCI